MDEQLNAALGDREILVLAIEDLPKPGEATTVMLITRTVPTTVNIEESGSVETKAFVISKDEALQLARRINEVVGPRKSGASR